MPLGRARWAAPLFVFLCVWGLTTRGKFSVAGDEPHYLMIAESLLSDRDLNLANNYANGDGRWFAVKDLAAGPHTVKTLDGQDWSVHDIGVAVVLLVPYAVMTRLAAQAPEGVLARFRMTRGHFAYALISLTMAAGVAIGLSWLLRGLARIAPARTAIAVMLVIGLVPPVFSHAFLVFPETPAFVVTCAVVWVLCARPEELTRGRMAALVLAVGCLPWLHRRLSFLTLGLGIVILLRCRAWFTARTNAERLTLAGLFLVPQIGLHAWTFNAWGQFGGPHMVDGLPFNPARWQHGSLGMLFDRERGLFGYAPIYMIAPACFALTWHETRLLLVPIVLSLAPMTIYADWAAGFAPAARFLVPLIPLLAIPLARAAGYRMVRVAAVALLAFQALIAVAIWQHPRVLWPKEMATNSALEKIPMLGPAYEGLLPSIATGDPLLWGWAWVIALGLGTTVLLRLERRMGSTRV